MNIKFTKTTKRIEGKTIVEEYKAMMIKRLKRLETFSGALENEIGSFSIKELDLDKIAKNYIKGIHPDLEELRWLAMVDLLSERMEK